MGIETLAALALVGSAVSAGASIFGGIEANKEQKRAAAEAERRANVEADQVQRQAARMRGEQAAGFAAAGVSPTTGSPLLVFLETAQLAEEEQAEIRRGGALEASQRRRAGRNAQIEGFLSAGTQIEGFLSAGSTLLTGGTQAATRLGRTGSVPRPTARPQ